MRLLGEILQENFGISAESIDAALAVQREKGGRIGEVLLQLRKINDNDLLSARSLQCGMEVVHALPTDFEPFFVPLVPIGFLKKFKMVPIASPIGSFVAMAEPFHYQQLDDLQRRIQWEGIKTVLTSQNEVFVAIHSAYDMTRKEVADQVMQDMDEQNPESILSEIEEASDLLDDTSDAPVIKLVNLVLSQAVRDNASDIHIESYKDRVKIRKRVDGILYDMYSPPRHVQGKLISRVKIMAKMDIAEKRLPQDGRIEIRIADKNVDLRVSTLPTSFGERVVMRLLDKSSSLVPLTDLGFSERDLDHFLKLIKAPHGIVLVTGPTGSGKTTTLYSALGIINKPDINIITVEDPIEYQMQGVSQVQVNPKIGLTFASGLRTIVRQDPDVILVGEIRDLETAEIAIQAALTGHLVFSTLHTNDAASAITRLTDMGVEPFLVSSAVNAILAQRLVRKICPHCRETYIPPPAFLERAGLSADEFAGRELYRGVGCPQCLETGYKGRIGIYELMSLTAEMKNLILTTSDAGQIKREALASRETGMMTLRQDGLRKVLAGLTTLEEVFRVT
ncbi:MAG: type II secretion system ATPase GspE [Desulfobulbus sp.]|jgi:general secretion pathway protein E|uniref:type II secretion system ATPase GspE n=1 Tax=Desulfobulbus sp. TaxID=895 RepID=UPI002849533A|nr:type II secretion system ATPase GspE [Desulfobulbus sp.]MDR2548851.1 type II secretion system ATPase GspE [Desulfobulbus sp.]